MPVDPKKYLEDLLNRASPKPSPSSVDEDMQKMRQRLMDTISSPVVPRGPMPTESETFSPEKLKQAMDTVWRGGAVVVAEQLKATPVAKVTETVPLTGTKLVYNTRTGRLDMANGPPENIVQPAKLNLGPQSQDVSADELKELIYQLRDEWSAETGEWDGSKMPVDKLADQLTKKLRIYKRTTQ